MNSEIELRDHLLVGPLRRSVNNASKVAGSIHDDATATKLGFRGGTVAGSIHLELFPRCWLRRSVSDGLSAGRSRCTSSMRRPIERRCARS